MKTEYSGIEIAYDEDRNEWLFDLRGRSRKADSLAKAKEAIDKEPKEKRVQAFPRFEAYNFTYNRLEKVTVTSVAEDGYYGAGKCFWVTGPDGKRKKERASSLYPVNDHNTVVIEKIMVKKKEIETHEQQISVLNAGLQQAKVPDEIK